MAGLKALNILWTAPEVAVQLLLAKFTSRRYHMCGQDCQRMMGLQNAVWLSV